MGPGEGAGGRAGGRGGRVKEGKMEYIIRLS